MDGKSLDFKLPKLTITLDAYAKMQAFIRESYIPQGSDKILMEVSGFGQLRLTEAGDIEVFDIFVLPQACSRGHTSLLDESIGDFLSWLAADDDKDPRAYAVWWHSHCVGSAYFSNIDTSTIMSMSLASYWVSLVGNVYGDLRGRVDIYRPSHQFLSAPALMPDATAEEIADRIEAVTPKVRAEVLEKVTYVSDAMGESEKWQHLIRIYGEERAANIFARREIIGD